MQWRIRNQFTIVRKAVNLGLSGKEKKQKKGKVMYLQIVLPEVNPKRITSPTQCAYADCSCRKFHLRQEVVKALRDTVYHEVLVHRYECLRCKRTFRVYPEGASRAQISQRVKRLAVVLYLLGLSYGAVSLTLRELGAYLCKSGVYEAVQEAVRHTPGLKRKRVFAGFQTSALEKKLIAVKCKGKWLPLSITATPISGLALNIDELSAGDTRILKNWIEPIVRSVGEEVLITNDANEEDYHQSDYKPEEDSKRNIPSG